jgi:hypothetical protein
MNLVSVILGLIALALALVATFGKPAAGVAALEWPAVAVAALGVLLACVQFRRPGRKTGLVVAGLVFAVAAGAMALWQMSATNDKQGGDIATKRLFKLHNTYYQYDENQDSGWFSAEIENISGKTISAFEARITLLSSKGEVLHEESLMCQDPLPAAKTLFVFTSYLNIRLGQKSNTHMEQSFEKMCEWAFGLDQTPSELLDARLADIRKQFAKARHTGKSRFVCTFITIE